MARDFEETVALVRDKFTHKDLSALPGKLAIQFNLTGEGGGTFYAALKDGRLQVEPYPYNDRDVAMTLTSENFYKLLEKRLDPVVAFSTGRLKVEGDLGKALEIKKLL